MKNCTKDTPRCAYHEKCCTENLLVILEYMNSLLKKNNIKYWLDYGTLLGSVREGNLIEYDTDIDIGILYEDKEKLLNLKNKIISDGFFFSKDKKLDFFRLYLSEINSLHADIFLWKKRPDGTLYREQYMKKDSNKGRDFNISYIQKTDIRHINGKPYPVPKDPEDFCRFRFGDSWNIKIKYTE